MTRGVSSELRIFCKNTLHFHRNHNPIQYVRPVQQSCAYILQINPRNKIYFDTKKRKIDGAVIFAETTLRRFSKHPLPPPNRSPPAPFPQPEPKPSSSTPPSLSLPAATSPPSLHPSSQPPRRLPSPCPLCLPSTRRVSSALRSTTVGVSERESGSGARRWKTCGKRRRKFGSASGSGEAGSASTSGEVRRSPVPSLVFPPSQPVPDHRAHLHAGHHHSLLDSIPPPPPTPSRAGSDPDAPRRPW